MKENYQTKERITSVCKAIGEHRQTKIIVEPKGGSMSARIEVIGIRAAATKDDIVNKICKVIGVNPMCGYIPNIHYKHTYKHSVAKGLCQVWSKGRYRTNL